MKLDKIKQLTESSFLTDKTEIENFLAPFQGRLGNFIINANGVVDLKFSTSLNVKYEAPMQKQVAPLWEYGSLIVDRLPISFGTAHYDFDISHNDLTTLDGCPHTVNGHFSCSWNPRLTSLEGMPSYIGKEFLMLGCNITSLRGINEHLCGMGRGGVFYCDWGSITEGGLGLILIENLYRIVNCSTVKEKAPFQIIKKYLGRPDDIFECQAELIEQGYEAYAQL